MRAELEKQISPLLQKLINVGKKAEAKDFVQKFEEIDCTLETATEEFKKIESEIKLIIKNNKIEAESVKKKIKELKTSLEKLKILADKFCLESKDEGLKNFCQSLIKNLKSNPSTIEVKKTNNVLRLKQQLHRNQGILKILKIPAEKILTDDFNLNDLYKEFKSRKENLFFDLQAMLLEINTLLVTDLVDESNKDSLEKIIFEVNKNIRLLDLIKFDKIDTNLITLRTLEDAVPNFQRQINQIINSSSDIKETGCKKLRRTSATLLGKLFALLGEVGYCAEKDKANISGIFKLNIIQQIIPLLTVEVVEKPKDHLRLESILTSVIQSKSLFFKKNLYGDIALKHRDTLLAINKCFDDMGKEIEQLRPIGK